MNPAEQFLIYTENLFGKEPEIFKGSNPKDGGVSPAVFCFRDIPELGKSTLVSYGLSLADHPEWKLNRKPELLLVVDELDTEWAVLLADLITDSRGEIPYLYGHRIEIPWKVGNSNVNRFVVFAPLHVPQAHYLDIDVNQSYRICLNALYPLTPGESQVMDMIGFENFWKDPNFNLETVKK
jgi:hypothetical protein